MKHIQRSWPGAILLVLFLTGCGGGGSNASSTPPPTPIPSGTLTSASGTAIDSDTNDPMAGAVDNNTPETAQAIPNPVTLGGFAAATATGETGDVFATQPDEWDSFRTTLSAGQTVTLTIADHPGGTQSTPDLDLYLAAVADPDTWVAESIGDTRTETVTVPSDGQYYVVIHAYAGASNYLLNILPAPASATRLPPSRFVPGEIVLRLQDRSLPLGVAKPMAHFAAQTGLRVKAGAAGRPALFELPRDETARLQSLMALGVAQPGMTWAGFGLADTEAQLRHDTLMAIKALRRRADVRSADPNYILHPLITPSDEYYGLQWHYPLINLPQAWDIETGATHEVIVAVVDTGVYLAHPDLSGSLVPGYDFIANPLISNDGDGIDADPNDPGDSPSGSSSYHGTHVAGTIAADTDNTSGVAGVSWGAKIMPIRVLGAGGGTTYDIMQGNRYAAGLPNDSGTVPDNPADIINLSLGCLNCYSQTDQETYDEIRAAGVIVIAAAGNEDTGSPGYPASYGGVVSVSAVDYLKQRAPYSNFGSTIDVAAPGGNMALDDNGDGYPDGVLSTRVDDATGSPIPNYSFLQGTSMAAPHMAGVVALMKSVNPAGVTPDALDAWLQSGDITEDLGTAGRDDIYGHGLIDAAKAVQAASGAAPTLLVVSPNTLNFGTTETVLPLTLAQSGSDAITVTSITTAAPWLTITASDGSTPPEGTDDGLGDYTITANRAGLTPQTYSSSIAITYTVAAETRNVNVPVTLTVSDGGSTGPAGDTGFTWILLVDARTLLTADVTNAANEDGKYSYHFSDIPEGEYYVIAGSDSDNDTFICDAGESCGAYPTLGLLQAVSVTDGTLSNIDFVLNFATDLNTGNSFTTAVDRDGFSRLAPAKQVEGMRR